MTTPEDLRNTVGALIGAETNAPIQAAETAVSELTVQRIIDCLENTIAEIDYQAAVNHTAADTVNKLALYTDDTVRPQMDSLLEGTQSPQIDQMDGQVGYQQETSTEGKAALDKRGNYLQDIREGVKAILTQLQSGDTHKATAVEQIGKYKAEVPAIIATAQEYASHL